MRYFLLLMNPCLRLIVQRETRSHKIFIVGRFKDSYIGALAYSYTGVENAVNHCSGMWSLAILSLTQWNSSMIWFELIWFCMRDLFNPVVGVFEKSWWRLREMSSSVCSRYVTGLFAKTEVKMTRQTDNIFIQIPQQQLPSWVDKSISAIHFYLGKLFVRMRIY